MATLDLSRATSGVDMTDPTLVAFSTPDLTFSGNWSFYTPAANYVHLTGSGMTYNSGGRALTGTVNSINIDVGSNDVFNPDIRISGISAAAPALDNGSGSFWRVLEGSDLILTPSANFAGNELFTIFGDGVAARAGTMAGGSDLIEVQDTFATVFGDVTDVGRQIAGAPAADYDGGDDEIRGLASSRAHSFTGDARSVGATGKLTGGDDIIVIQSAWSGAEAIGDAMVVEGIAGNPAEVDGGDDFISAAGASKAHLAGDVFAQRAFSIVRGGDDTISGGDAKEDIVGDVYNVSGGRLIGGNDTIAGGHGADQIYGDMQTADGGSRIFGGADVIHGGENDDFIYGEGLGPAIVTGGNDRLHGEAGADTIFGQTGNDLLDGGEGGDFLFGGIGNDTYVVDSVFDVVSEQAGEGIDTLRTSVDFFTLKDNVENLAFTGSGGFFGAGNDLGNVITGGSGADSLEGRGGSDRLIGAAGSDFLYGDVGADELQGGSGNDLLVGGAGVDRLTGGIGNDTFHFALPNEGGDRIADFSNVAGNNDTLRFTSSSFSHLPTGALAANRFVANADGQTTTLDQRFVYETDAGVLRYDANGSAAGGVTVIATLTGAPTLTVDDFAII